MTAAALAAAAVPAFAATSTATPAGAESTSNLTLLGVTAVGNKVQALQAALTSTNLASPGAASIVVTPLLKDGAAVVPPVTVTDGTANQPGVPSKQQSIAGILSVTSPAAALHAERTATGALAQLSATGQNLLSVLGLPVGGALTLENVSDVAKADSSAGKHLTLTGLALPSIKDMLGGLGLDLSKLPLDTLLSLVDKLNLSTATLDQAVAQVNSQIDSLQSQIDDVTSQITSKTADLSAAQAQLTQLTDAVTAAQAQVQAALTQLNLPGVSSCSTIPTIPPVGVDLSALTTACDQLKAATEAVTNADLDTVIQTLQDAIDTLQATLADLTSQLAGVTGPLVDQVLGILDGTPLVSLAKLDVTTLAEAGTTHKADVTGTVDGLKVAGTDVLKAVTGGSSIDIAKLAGSTLTSVQSQISGVLGQLSSVLSGVTALPDLDVPAPVVKVLQKTTSLDPVGGLEAAQATVTALQIDWAGLSIPDAVAVPGVANLVPHTQQAHATLAGQPLSLTIGSMSELAKSRPGTVVPPATTPAGTPTGTPTTTPTLPFTGVAGWLPIVALALVGGALGIRRWRSAQI